MSGSVRQREAAATWELNLAPMLDMLVSLMTVLLMGFTTVRVGILETALPQPVAAAMEQDRNKKERDFELAVALGAKMELVLKIKNKGDVRTVNIASKDGVFDTERLHHEVVQLKLRNPGVFRIEVNPSEQLEYKEVVKVMDSVRQTKKGDPEIRVKDEKSGQEAVTTFLFPDIVFANVVEG